MVGSCAMSYVLEQLLCLVTIKRAPIVNGVLKAPSRTYKYLGVQGGGETCFKGASMGHPLKCNGT